MIAQAIKITQHEIRVISQSDHVYRIPNYCKLFSKNGDGRGLIINFAMQKIRLNNLF
jgi:hypothetical protein